MSGIRVSVVTVCLNAKDVIEKTITSVINQNYDNIEYIIVDGSSSDGTIEVIDRYKDSISIIVTEGDSGVYDAMNKGIRLATGDLIGFMNAGDYYEENIISAVVDTYEETNADIVYGDAVLVYPEKMEHRSHKDVCLEEYFERNPIIHQSVFVKAGLQKKHEFNTNYKILSDYDFFLGRFISGATFAYIDRIVSYYDMSGISSKEQVQTAFEARTILLNAIRDSHELMHQYYNKIKNDFLFKMFMIHCEYLPQYIYYVNESLKEITLRYDVVVVFGTGDIARRLMSKIKIDFDFFIDNNCKRHGQLLNEKMIFPISVLRKYKNDRIIVLLFSTRYEKEMRDNICSISEDIDCAAIYQIGVSVERKLYGLSDVS